MTTCSKCMSSSEMLQMTATEKRRSRSFVPSSMFLEYKILKLYFNGNERETFIPKAIHQNKASQTCSNGILSMFQKRGR